MRNLQRTISRLSIWYVVSCVGLFIVAVNLSVLGWWMPVVFIASVVVCTVVYYELADRYIRDWERDHRASGGVEE